MLVSERLIKASMNLKYINIIIDKEDFVKDFTEKATKARNYAIAEYESSINKHKEELRLNTKTSCFRAVACISIAAMWFTASAKVVYLFIIPILLNLVSCFKSYFDLRSLNKKLKENDILISISNSIFEESMEYFRSASFQEIISSEEAHRSSDDVIFLHLFYTHDIKSIEYADDEVKVSYVKDDNIETAILKNFVKKDNHGPYDSISYVRGNLLIGNNGAIINHATDSKELEVI